MIDSRDVPKPLITSGGDDIEEMTAWVKPRIASEFVERSRTAQEVADRRRREARLAHHVTIDSVPAVEQMIMVNDPKFVAARRAALQAEWGPRE